jgi:hypothetical protein
MAKNKLVEPTIEEPMVETTETPTEINVIIDIPVESVEVDNNYPGVNTRAYRS